MKCNRMIKVEKYYKLKVDTKKSCKEKNRSKLNSKKNWRKDKVNAIDLMRE